MTQIFVGTPEGNKVKEIVFNGEINENHHWVMVDVEKGEGTRFKFPIESDENGNAIMIHETGTFTCLQR